MRIELDAVIAEENLTRYLLAPRDIDDKSRFLARGGFLPGNPQDLLNALRKLASTAEAVEDEANEYGEFFRLEGELIGPRRIRLRVVTIWLRRRVDGKVHFVTLKPSKGEGR